MIIAMRRVLLLSVLTATPFLGAVAADDLSSAALMTGIQTWAHPLDTSWLKGVTDREAISYRLNEEMTFTLTLEGLSGELEPGVWSLDWKRTGDDGQTEVGRVPLTDKPFVYKTRLGKPGFVRLEAFVVDKDGKRFKKSFTGDTTTPEGREAANRFERQPKEVFFDGGAGVEIDTLQALPEPKDFDAFWAQRRARLANLPIVADVKPARSNENGVCYAVSVNCAGGMPSTFYMSVPAKCAKGVKVPALFESWGYSGNRRPYVIDPDPDRICVNFNPHGFELGREDEYYREYYRAISGGRGVLGAETADKPQWPVSYAFDIDKNSQRDFAYFSGMTWRLMRCLQYVKSRPVWDGVNLMACGGSLGGLQTILAAGRDPDVNEAEASIPWCCDIGGETLGRNRGGWFVRGTALGYYDPVNIAKRIPKTCHVVISRAGLGDYVCPPSGVAILWNNMTCPKKIVWVQGSQHGYVPPEAYDGRDIVCEK